MINSQTNFYELENKEYIDWLLSLLNSEPTQMITEKTYSNIFENGSEKDRTNLLNLNKFAYSLNDYAIKNYINTSNTLPDSMGYYINFSIILKVDNKFLLIESASSTFSSYIFVSSINNDDNFDYIDWELYSRNKKPVKIEEITSKLEVFANKFSSEIKDILNSELFNDSNLSYTDKKDLVINFLLTNLKLD